LGDVPLPIKKKERHCVNKSFAIFSFLMGIKKKKVTKAGQLIGGYLK